MEQTDQRRRVVVTNVFADDNRGGAAITAATINTVQLAFPGCSIVLVAIEQDPDNLEKTHRHTKARFPDIAILPAPFRIGPGWLPGFRSALRSLWVLIRPHSAKNGASAHIATSDLVVSKCGHVFIERGNLRGVLALWFTAWPLLYARRLGVPTVAFCTSVGPFRSRSSTWMNALILRRTSLVLTRDPLSYKAALELGVPSEHVVEVPDSVFSFDPPSASEMEQVTARLGLQDSNFGVITVRTTGTPAAKERFLNSVADALHRILDDRVVERLAIVVQVDGIVASDARDSLELLRLLDDKRVELFRQDLPPRDLIALYGAASFLLGCRMHSTIFSMIAGTPAIAIALRGAKVHGVYNSLGIDTKYVVPFDSADANTISTLIREVVERDDLRERITQAVDEARRHAMTIEVLLKSVIRGQRNLRNS